jgi:putative colanic acid biosynthesis acetyltransferase WcaF
MSADMIQDGRGQPPAYGLMERLARLAWAIAYLLLFRPVPRIFNPWHRTLLRMFGAKVGRGVAIYPSAEITIPWMISLGDYVVISEDVLLYSLGPVRIGRHTVLSFRSVVCAGTHDYENQRMPLIRAPVVIGEGCWICAEAFVGPGVTVGDGAVVGVRSVVVDDLPANMVCAGDPCRPLKPRVIKQAQEIEHG